MHQDKLGSFWLAGALPPRVWTAKIVEARKTLLAADGRIVDANRHVIPRLSYELAGWPAGTDAANIVQSTLDTTGTAVLPLRTFRNAGVHTWIVATEKEFTVSQFSIEINGQVHQIIIQLLDHSGATKGAGKREWEECIQEQEEAYTS